ncbi:hypothetical protein RJ639_013726 [Escallonia herrerae]|uniref:Protein RNA-directed DNA methylation 3 n=1 Tax=Escallonia herrerae TaxID=1293975 RepID=A0AA88VF50_9ASTE|nr:hypothetical protein RJ639_013726 [Escallonia herrerae]
MASKGKEVATGYDTSGKRKRDGRGEKSGHRKRGNPNVLQFFEDAAYEVDGSEEDSDNIIDDDFLEEEFGSEVKVKNEPVKAPHLPLLPKEEEMTEEELEKMLEERYKPGSNFIRCAEDGYEAKRLIERDAIIASAKDPTIWKVKCMVGRERHSAFCLMQKYVDFKSLGTKLQIISAFAIEHVKGFIYIEADKQCDVNEACNGLSGIYSTRVTPVPINEVSHLLTIRSKSNGVSVGTWARVKNGKYKGDLAEVVDVNDARKRATVKLIPRLDLQAIAEKLGGEVTAKKTATPAPRLLSSSELEEFRPLIQHRRDRETGKMFEFLNGMMLKNGYLYKRVPIDSLSFWGVMPSEDELLKFEFSKNDESNDLEWLSELYGEEKKKRTIYSSKGGGKGEASSSSSLESVFEVHDLVLFGRTGYGVIICKEKDDSFKVLKEGSEGPAVVTLKPRELKKASCDKRFTAVDQHKKIISINDAVRVLEGPLEDRQGIVKQIYRGTIFIHDETDQDNSGYFCSKARVCEKIILSGDACSDKGGKSGPLAFDDFSASPKSPLSPKKPWEARESNRNFNREGKDGMFSVGQSLRIRVGPLKGYLCRVMAIRHSDVTVKLDSQQKILTVKPEHLSEVRGKSSAISTSDDPESVKPFDLLGTQDGSTDWTDRAGTSTEGVRWGTGDLSTERTSWPDFPGSGLSLPPDSGSANPPKSLDNDIKKDGGRTAWETKATANQSSSWGAAVANTEEVGGTAWETKATASQSSSWVAAVADKSAIANTQEVGGTAWETKATASQSSSWGAAVADKRAIANTQEVGGTAWETKATSSQSSSWGAAVADKPAITNMEEVGRTAWETKATASQSSSWGTAVADKPAIANRQDVGGTARETKATASQSSSWGAAVASKPAIANTEELGRTAWETKATASQSSSWGAAVADKPAIDNTEEVRGWGKSEGNWNKASCNKWGAKMSIGDQGGSSKDGGSGASTWGKAVESISKGLEEDSWDKSTATPKKQSVGWGNVDRSLATGVKESQANNGGSLKKIVLDATSWGAGRLGSQDKGTSEEIQEGAWGKSAEKSWSKDGPSGSKVDWKSSSASPASQTRDWGNAGGNWGKPIAATSGWKKAADVMEDQTQKLGSEMKETENAKGWGKGGSSNKGQSDSWNKPKTFDSDRRSSWSKQEGGSWISQDGASSWSKQAGVSSWNMQAAGNTEDESKGRKDKSESWQRPNSFSGGRGSGGWIKGGTGDDDADQHASWERPKAFEGGRGSGGRRGRGCGRGGRDHFGRGSSFDQGQSSGWNKGGTSDGTSSCKLSSWKSDQAAGGWGKDKPFDGGKKDDTQTSAWNSTAGLLGEKPVSWGSMKKGEEDAAGGSKGGSSWNKQEGGSSWNKQDGGSSWHKQDGGSPWNKQEGGSSWNKQEGGSSWNKQDGGSSWSKQGGASSWDKQDGGSSWNKQGGGSSWNKQGGGSSWNKQEGGSSSWNKNYKN